jgi:hypothetical protein
MIEDDDPVFTHPESYGIENIEAPGEPDRDRLPPVEPVPGTGREAKQQHREKHNEDDNSKSGADFKDRKEREERDELRDQISE